MKIQTLINNYVSITPLTHKSEFDLLLPTENEETQRWGFIEMVGPGVPDSNGQLIPTVVQPGKLAYMMLHGQESIVDPLMRKSTDVVLASEFDILGMADPDYVDGKIVGIKNFQPLGSWCLIEKIEETSHTFEDILLPEGYVVPTNLAKVLRTGLGWMTMNRTTVPLQVKDNDYVLFKPYNVLEIKLHLLGIPGNLYLVDHQDIFGIVNLDEN